MEQWCDIPGYEGLYQVSSLGKIRRNGKFNEWRDIADGCEFTG